VADITAWIQAHPLILIGILAVYAMLPPTSPIKVFINKFIGGIFSPQPTPPGPVPAPGPTPVPVPTPVPGPVGLDWATIIQLLMGLLTKARASGDKELEDAALKVATAMQQEQAKMAMSPMWHMNQH